MNDKVKEMVKSVVEENAVGFKDATANALYEKIGSRLENKYKEVSKVLFKKLDEEMATNNSEQTSDKPAKPAIPPGKPGTEQHGPPSPPKKPKPKPQPRKPVKDEGKSRGIGAPARR